MIMFMKNIAIAGGFLFLVANGAGNYSLDNRKDDLNEFPSGRSMDRPMVQY